MADHASGAVTFASLRKRLLEIDLPRNPKPLPEPDADRDPWGRAKQREVSEVLRRVQALLEQIEPVEAMPYMERYRSIIKNYMGRDETKFRVSPEKAASFSSRAELIDGYRSCRDDVAMMLEGMAAAFPKATLNSTPKPKPFAKRHWETAGLPESLKELAKKLEENDGEAAASELLIGKGLRPPADIILKNKKRWGWWIKKYLDIDHGIYRLKQQL